MTRPETSPSELCILFAGGTTTGQTDEELLEAFHGGSSASAEAAFRALVNRHAGMVWGVCRRGLRKRTDVEDAFQATFLVLAKKSGSLRCDAEGGLGRWLYGVARRVAFRLDRVAARQPAFASTMSSSDDPAMVAERREVCRAVAAEVDRLPWKYKRPIELCDFDGLTYEQAGRYLGWPTATIKSRLARGRDRLRSRLLRQGLAPVAVFAVSELSRACRAGVSQSVLHSTVQAGTIAAGMVPTAVARLAEGALQSMFWHRIKSLTLMGLFGLGLTTTGVAWHSQDGASSVRTSVQEPLEPRSEKPTDSQWLRRLPDGTTLEILGVSPCPSGPDTWWTPDGRPLTDPDFDPSSPGDGTGRFVANEGSHYLAVVYRVLGKPARTNVAASIDESSSTGERDVLTADGQPANDLHSLQVMIPKTLPSLTVRFRTASSDWQTVQGLDHFACGISGGSGRNFASSGAIGLPEGGTKLCLAYDVGASESLRVTAVDAVGGEHTPSRTRDFFAGGVRQMIASFSLAPESIQEFSIQTRPIDEIILPDVAASPVGGRPDGP